MVIPSVFVLAVLAFVLVARLAFGVAHAAVYASLARRFERTPGRLARVGKGLSLAAIVLPAVNLVLEVGRMVSTYQALPPGGMRRLVEIPIGVLAGALFESLLGLGVVAVLLTLLWLQGRIVRGRIS